MLTFVEINILLRTRWRRISKLPGCVTATAAINSGKSILPFLFLSIVVNAKSQQFFGFPLNINKQHKL